MQLTCCLIKTSAESVRVKAQLHAAGSQICGQCKGHRSVTCRWISNLRKVYGSRLNYMPLDLKSAESDGSRLNYMPLDLKSADSVRVIALLHAAGFSNLRKVLLSNMILSL